MGIQKSSRCVAKYNITYFDFLWNPLPSAFPSKSLSAHEMWQCVERWNRNTQAEARNSPMDVLPVELPEAMTIEVVYVEEERKTGRDAGGESSRHSQERSDGTAPG